MHGSTTFTSGGMNIDAETFQPKSPNGGVIVLAYGSDGMIDNKNGPWASMLREYAQDLSGKRFLALIPDYFLRTKTPAASIDYAQGGGKIVLANADTWTSTLGDAIGHAKTFRGVDAKRVGLLGFSLGGYLCLRQRSQANVLVEFFAPRFDGAGARAHAGLRAQIHHGSGDVVVPYEDNATPNAQSLRNEGVSVDLNEYKGAGHGFVGSDGSNSAARTASKAAALKFFEMNL